jgi:glycosyltransferase involved in cell wall biosynthesis
VNTSNQQKLKVLLIAEQCNPEWASVPLVAWNYFRELNKFVEITLVTHDRNQSALEKTPYRNIAYISEGKLARLYYTFVEKFLTFVFRGKMNWPVYHLLTYPNYAEFNRKVYQQFKDEILSGEYDVVHALTPMMPRYPVKAIRACKKTPFLIGPVNGGVPFPKGFQAKAREEFAHFNFLRALGRFLIPGYVETYKKATKILVGSSYTLEMLKNLFQLPDQKLELFYENGIPKSFLTASSQPTKQERINLIFVGRLVPYKCADVVIEAIGKLNKTLQSQIKFTIVGDGSEKEKLVARVDALNLNDIVQFTGWVDHQKTLEYYSQSDIFCFPSIREFGGAVVLEAMACGLPCIVVNNGGIGEYVTEATGFKIEPLSREYLIEEMAKKIEILVENQQLRSEMSVAAVARAQEFEWEAKAKQVAAVYEELATVQQPQAQPQPRRSMEVLPGVTPPLPQDQTA